MNKITISHKFFIAFILLFGCRSENPKPVSIINLPGIEEFAVDGSTAEWSKIKGYRLWANPLGKYPEPADLEAEFKASWNDSSLALLFEVSDENFTSDTILPWKGDAIEVFLSPSRGSENILQISIVPSGENDFILVNDRNPDTLGFVSIKDIKSFTSSKGNKRTTEVQIPFSFNVKNKSLALQVYVDDTDTADAVPQQLVWYPVGQSYNSSFSMFSIKFCEGEQTVFKGSSRVVITDNEKIKLIVFGSISGDKIDLYRNGELIQNFTGYSKSLSEPDIFDISSSGINTETDTLFTTVNKEVLFQNEMFLVPRLYDSLPEKRFEREIRNFMLKDRMSFPPENATLFVGSSSIVRWENLKRDFKELQVIQRGFGGSTSPEALMYINQIVLPYKPSKIVYYEGDNDIPMGLSSEEIRDNVKSFLIMVRDSLPLTRIYILSPKPSINRMHLWEKYRDTHKLLKELAIEFDNTEYVDVASLMFGSDGKLNYSLFVEDGIHMNDTGYAIWTESLRKALELD